MSACDAPMPNLMGTLHCTLSEGHAGDHQCVDYTDQPHVTGDSELGQWDVDVNADDTGVILDFTHFGESGIESFKTALPREQALSLATAILNAAVLLPESDEHLT